MPVIFYPLLPRCLTVKKSLINTIAVFGLSLFTLTAHAEQANGANGMNMANMKMDPAEMKSSGAMGVNEGEVKFIDQARKRITIKHGPIKSKTVEMTPMTMSFPVQNAPLLSSVKVGDKIKFNMENKNNVAVVTSLSVQK